MSSFRVGVAMGRKSIVLAGIKIEHGKPELAFKLAHAVDRPSTAIEQLEAVLAQLPPEWRRAEVRMALSPCWLACAELFEAPYHADGQLEMAKGSLAESRCAGETIEELAVDCYQRARTSSGSLVEVVAIQQERLAAVRSAVAKALPQARLSLVGAIPAVLCSVLSEKDAATCVLASETAGEALALSFNKERRLVGMWRSAPMDVSGKGVSIYAEELATSLCAEPHPKIILLDGDVRVLAGLEVECRLLPAVAVALTSTDQCTNLLRGAPDAPVNLRAKLKTPLLRLLASAAVFLCVLALYFIQKTNALEEQNRQCANVEKKLWQAYNAGTEYKPGCFNAETKRAVLEYTKSQANSIPSALSFWSEVGAAMPSAEKIGLELESLQLGSDGGRLVARVNPGTPDPLSNAATLERSLNSSPLLSARGEYENKNTDVIVRMRLDYRPAASEGRKK